jgi:hypothetical protein
MAGAAHDRGDLRQVAGKATAQIGLPGRLWQGPGAPDGVRPTADLGSSKPVDLMEGWWPEPSPAWTPPAGFKNKDTPPSRSLAIGRNGLRRDRPRRFQRAETEYMAQKGNAPLSFELRRGCKVTGTAPCDLEKLGRFGESVYPPLLCCLQYYIRRHAFRAVWRRWRSFDRSCAPQLGRDRGV